MEPNEIEQMFNQVTTQFKEAFVQFRESLEKLNEYQQALASKLHALEDFMNGKEQNKYDRFIEMRADEVLKNPAMERQVTRDWEILAFGNKPNVFRKQDDGFFIIPGYPSKLDCDELLKHEPIHSVRRLSDNTVWTVGDSTSRGAITRFMISDGTIFACGQDWNTLIRTLMKPEPLFTTTDGMNVKQYEYVYKFAYPSGTIHQHLVSAVVSQPYYSTREAAKAAYSDWLCDQPVLSMNDIEELLTEWNRPDAIDILKRKLSGIHYTKPAQK